MERYLQDPHNQLEKPHRVMKPFKSNDGSDLATSSFGNNGQKKKKSSQGKLNNTALESVYESADELNILSSPGDADESLLRVVPVHPYERSPSPGPSQFRPVATSGGKKSTAKPMSKLDKLRNGRSSTQVLMKGHKKPENVRREADSRSTTATTPSTSSDRSVVSPSSATSSGSSYKKPLKLRPLAPSSSSSNLPVGDQTIKPFPLSAPSNPVKGKGPTVAAPFPMEIGSASSSKKLSGPASFPMAHSTKENTPPSNPMKPAKFPLPVHELPQTKSTKNILLDTDAEVSDDSNPVKVNRKSKGKKKQGPAPFPMELTKTSSSSKIGSLTEFSTSSAVPPLE